MSEYKRLYWLAYTELQGLLATLTFALAHLSSTTRIPAVELLILAWRFVRRLPSVWIDDAVCLWPASMVSCHIHTLLLPSYDLGKLRPVPEA